MLTRNFPISTSSRTLIVCGIERGGTSMVAQVLAALGVFMGENLEATAEDHEIGLLVKAVIATPTDENIAALKEEIGRRNAVREQWGFKVPNIFLAPDIMGWLRSPVLVCIFRDSLAIAQRVTSAMRRDTEAALASVGWLQTGLLKLFVTTPLPAVGFSYEKALLKPDAFVEELIAALGLAPSEAQRAAATACIVPSPEAYLAVSTAADIAGHLERAACGQLVGWILNIADEDEIITATVEIDGATVGTVEANLFRPDLFEYCTTNFNHGFRFRLPEPFLGGAEHTARVVPQCPGRVRIGGQDLRFHIPEAFGTLESFIEGSLRGWLWRRDGRTTETTVRLLVDDRPVAEVKADYPRDDLEPAGYYGASGIAFEIPHALLDGKVHKAELLVEGCATWHIADSPRFLTFPQASQEPASENGSPPGECAARSGEAATISEVSVPPDCD